LLESSRLPVPLSEIRTVWLCPAAMLSRALHRTTTFFLVFVLFAVIAITLPPLSVSIAVSVSVIVQLDPAGPVQAIDTLVVVPVVFE
jgi:succinate dehydrogenase/fumarate reductase cytochrome b subunit